MQVLLSTLVPADLLPFLKTLLDIVLLRKGPQHLPHSLIMLGMAIGLWVVALLVSITLIDYVDESSFFSELAWAIVVLSIYSTLVYVAGFADRILQTITAIIGCGALLSVLYAVVYSGLGPLLGRAFLELMVYGFVLWSLSIKGHIIATAISTRWYLGALIAAAIFVGQLVVSTMLSSPG